MWSSACPRCFSPPSCLLIGLPLAPAGLEVGQGQGSASPRDFFNVPVVSSLSIVLFLLGTNDLPHPYFQSLTSASSQLASLCRAHPPPQVVVMEKHFARRLGVAQPTGFRLTVLPNERAVQSPFTLARFSFSDFFRHASVNCLCVLPDCRGPVPRSLDISSEATSCMEIPQDLSSFPY